MGQARVDGWYNIYNIIRQGSIGSRVPSHLPKGGLALSSPLCDYGEQARVHVRMVETEKKAVGDQASL